MNSRLEQGEFSRSILHNGNALHVLSHSAPDQVLGLWRPSPCQLQEWLRLTDTPLLSRWFSHSVNDRRRVCTKIYIRMAAFCQCDTFHRPDTNNKSHQAINLNKISTIRFCQITVPWSTLGPPAQLQKGCGCSAVKANQFRIFHRLLNPCFCQCVDHVGDHVQ